MLVVTLLLACATTEPVKPAPKPAPMAPATAPKPVPAEPSIREIALTGSPKLMFDVDQSPAALQMQTESCEKSSGGDAAKKDACMTGMKAQAAKEGIRFEQDAAGAWWYVSFGSQEDGTEELYLKGKIEVVGEEPGKLTVKLVPPFEGAQVAKLPPEVAANPPTMTLERVDASTVTVDTGSPKGKLAYRKAAADPPPAIAETVKGASPQIQGCVEAALKTKPELKGRVSASWKITDGVVSDARIVSDDTGDDALGTCILGVVKGMQFPKGLTADVAEFPWIVSGQ